MRSHPPKPEAICLYARIFLKFSHIGICRHLCLKDPKTMFLRAFWMDGIQEDLQKRNLCYFLCTFILIENCRFHARQMTVFYMFLLSLQTLSYIKSIDCIACATLIFRKSMDFNHTCVQNTGLKGQLQLNSKRFYENH